MTLESIAKQLNVNERTLRRWKAADNWKNRRLEYIKSKTTFHEDLYNFGRTLLESIKTDISNSERIEPSRLYIVTKIMTLLKNIKNYEDKVLNDKYSPEKASPREISPETIREIEEKIFGITYEE
ncbi:MAG: phage terminase small subunit-related protein [Candidatus Gastranaerophilales bacterium]|nr:phage terminase small subunit-related protein [Candidatus Gastranaerophilales bacterium]